MNKQFEIPLFDFTISITEALDLISHTLVDHHKKVAYIALSIATELDLPKNQIRDIALAAILHDIGAISIEERIATLDFDCATPHNHEEKGYWILNAFSPFANAAQIVRFHHSWWKGNGNMDRFEKQTEIFIKNAHIRALLRAYDISQEAVP